MFSRGGHNIYKLSKWHTEVITTLNLNLDLSLSQSTLNLAETPPALTPVDEGTAFQFPLPKGCFVPNFSST